MFAYDPSVTFPENRSPKIKFKKWGVVGLPSKDSSYKTLSEIMKLNGHSRTKISYLKIDIEGHEMGGLPEWLKAGALDNVTQIAIEIHLNPEDRISSTRQFFKIFQDLHVLGQYRIVNWEANGCWKNVDLSTKYVDLFEIVLKKISMSDDCAL